MNKYNALLLSVARRYKIAKGTMEDEIEWKKRLVYSICGMMAYASLWDDTEEEVSIVHMKKRISDIFSDYKSIYPEISASFLVVSGNDSKSKSLEDEIADQFLKAGVVYHRPNHIAPSMKREGQAGNILFQRGISIDSIDCVSGIGFYSERAETDTKDSVRSMFGLEQDDLLTLWHNTLSVASWKSEPVSDQNREYLRVDPPFNQGYWVNKPDMTGRASILRTGMNGAQLYYLYRYSGSTMEVSPLPEWQVESHNYRSLACACLKDRGTLPPIEYSEDGALVSLHMNYLLPPRELEFLKLYSWPEKCISLPYNFKRKLQTEVFTAIKDLLSDEGYEFTGGTF